MREIVGNIWDFHDRAIIAITTNGQVDRSGRAILGRGCARQALVYFPELPEHLGRLLQESGNHVFDLGRGLVNFPVEETPWSVPDLRLIRRSAAELKALADQQGWSRVIVPRPGCGGGGLAWSEVRAVVEEYFDDRFSVISSVL